MAEVDNNVEQNLPSIPKQEVVYCGVCSIPPEYCSFGPTLDRCKGWLADNQGDLYEKLYPGGPDGEKDANSGDNRAARKAAKALKIEEDKKEKSRIIVKRIERNKRKYITSVFGLEAFDVELKKAAKLFANKFACGASVTKNPQGQEEIVVQGDVSDDLFELIPATWKKITDDKIDLVEDKKKKKGAE